VFPAIGRSVSEYERSGKGRLSVSFLREASGGPTYSTCSSFSSPSFTATASVLLLPLLGSFFDIPPTDDRETGGCDEFRPNGQLKPIFRRLAYGLLGFAKSVTVETSAREEKDRDLPPKNFDNPGLLQNKDKRNHYQNMQLHSHEESRRPALRL